MCLKAYHFVANMVLKFNPIPRNDRLDRKRVEVNQNLKTESYRHNIAYVDHENIEKNKHLNRSGLHLNATGTGILCYNLLSFTCDVFDLDFLH